MGFDWQNFASLADKLATENDESAQRTAISRYYYAAFHIARQSARKMSGYVPPRDKNAHIELANYWYKEGFTELATTLAELRLWRNRADYDDRVKGLPQLVQSSSTRYALVWTLLSPFFRER